MYVLGPVRCHSPLSNLGYEGGRLGLYWAEQQSSPQTALHGLNLRGTRDGIRASGLGLGSFEYEAKVRVRITVKVRVRVRVGVKVVAKISIRVTIRDRQCRCEAHGT